MLNFEFKNPTKIFFGKGMVEKLGKEAKKYGNKVLVCTGGGSVKKMGLFDQVIRQLKENQIEIFELSGIEPNPKMSSVYKGIEICKKEGIELIVAVGGGSCIDGAKAIAAGSKVEGDAWEYFLKQEDIEDAIPLAAILTLPATGTEMNGNSVVSNWDTKEKLPIYGSAIYPVFSILDPELTFTIPQNHTVNGIIDIIIHSLEQYFTPTKEVDMQHRMTEGLVKTVMENARRILVNPKDYDARAAVMFCGTVANNHWIGVGKEHDWASHMIEHELSALYDVAHGAGLSVIYPNWMKYVMEYDPSKFVTFAKNTFGITEEGKTPRQVALEGAEKMREFFTEIGGPSTLEELGIDQKDIPYMAKQAVKYGKIGGYRKLDAQDVEKILYMCCQ